MLSLWRKVKRFYRRLFPSDGASSWGMNQEEEIETMKWLMQQENRPEHLNYAIDLFGLREIVGNEHNSTIVNMHFEVTGNRWTDEVAWCASFVGYCLKKTGFKYKRSARARSYENYGPKKILAGLGDICVFWRGSKSSGSGHIGFYIKETDKRILLLGGNQSNKVCFKWYSKSKFLGYYEPILRNIIE